MKFRPAFAVLSMTLALAACGGELPWEKKAAEPEAQGHSGPPTVSPIDQPIETGTTGVAISTAEASTMATNMFRASGQGWVATAGAKSVVYERPGQKSVGVATRRMTYGKGVEFIGVMSGRPFALNIQAAECTDASGAKQPFTARLSTAGGKMNGCASATDVMPKAQTQASSATAKPKAAAPKAAPKAAAPAAAAAATTDTGSTETTTPATTTPATTPAPATTAPAATTPAPAVTAPAVDAPATPATPATPAPASDAPAAAGTTTTPATPAPATPAPATTTPAPAAPVVTAPVIPAPVVTAPVVTPAPAATPSTEGEAAGSAN
ncbi:hypothetical protein QWZ10_11855 [Paracoccus cavernae]|uniref:Uncharacterized protein n=1 Tax=Paracoccus cavernae TaxID=1571207 RepID=A0ABT8D682_9RHOB|nr:hypothetical protein [Paracoccus cavernae]